MVITLELTSPNRSVSWQGKTNTQAGITQTTRRGCRVAVATSCRVVTISRYTILTARETEHILCQMFWKSRPTRHREFCMLLCGRVHQARFVTFMLGASRLGAAQRYHDPDPPPPPTPEASREGRSQHSTRNYSYPLDDFLLLPTVIDPGLLLRIRF